MAKSRSFFGLRRGSTKAFTFQVLGGAQITKDRVSEVANPQTTGQMPTRIALAVVSKAAARLMPLIGMSFEGAGNAVENRRQFQAANMRHMRQLFIASVNPRGTSPIYSRQAYGIPKGYAAIVPNKYIVSKGSLVTPEYFTPEAPWKGAGATAYQEFTSVTKSGVTEAFDYGTYNAAQFLGKLFGVQPGDQMTYVAVITQNGEGYVYNGISEIGYMTRFGEMISRRVVFVDPGTSIEIAAGTTDDQVIAYAQSCIDTEKSDSLLAALLAEQITVEAGNNAKVIGAPEIGEDEIAGDKHSEYTTRACGWFLSRLDTIGNAWRYSSCELTLAMQPYSEVDVADEFLWYGVRYADAVGSYLKTTNAAASNLYTQQGGEDDNLGF